MNTGSAGSPGTLDRWVSHREFWFDADRSNLHVTDTTKVAEIAAYLRQNPSLQLGIDGTMPTSGTDRRDVPLAERRIKAVRDALIEAGVPASSITTGSFGDPRIRRDRRVEVLITTRR